MLTPDSLWNQLEWPHGRPLVLAFSGGGDSLALLHLLLGSPWPLHLAHLDHGSGAAQADRVRSLASQHDLPLHLRRFDVQRWARRYGLSWEAAGRWLRYRWLESLSRQLGALILTGHHADDQAETLVMRLIQGTTLDGLSGIQPRTSWLARPLLAYRRSQLRDYLQGRGLPWYEDPANQQQRFLRVQVRQQVMPLLESLNPSTVEHLCRLARDAWECRQGPSARHRFEVLLHRSWKRLAPLGARWERSHADALWLALRQPRGSWNLPGRCWCEWTPSSLWLGRERPRLPALLSQQGPSAVAIHLRPGNWVWRTRQPGDRWGDSLLKDVMQSRGLPRRWRDQVGLLAQGSQVAWLEGWGPHPHWEVHEKGPAQNFWLAPWVGPIRLEDCPRPSVGPPDR